LYDAFVAYGLQYLLHKRRMKFYRKMYAAALLSEFLQHAGRILNAYFPKDKLAEIFLTAVQCGMPHREGVRRLLYDLDFNHGSLRFRSWDIQEWLGHSSYNTTANIYAHLDTSSKNTSASKMSNVVIIEPGISTSV
jgi:hypothetical protein